MITIISAIYYISLGHHQRFICLIAIGLYDGRNKKAFKGYSIIHEIGFKLSVQDEYRTSLNALVSNNLLQLVWFLNVLNREISEIDAQIKKALDESPKPDNIVDIMKQSEALNPLRERRDLLKLRYLRQVEKVFDGLIVKEVE